MFDLWELLIAFVAYVASIITWPTLRTLIRGKSAELDAAIAYVEKLKRQLRRA